MEDHAEPECRVAGHGRIQVPRGQIGDRTVGHLLTLACLHAGRARLSDVAAIGITNQRETTVLWDRATSEPIDKAIVWQCRRTAERCEELKSDERLIRETTGLVVDETAKWAKVIHEAKIPLQ